MPSPLEKPRPSESQPETIQTPEQDTAETLEFSETDLQEMADQAQAQIDAEQTRIFRASDERIENAPTSLGLDETKSFPIKQGFMGRIENIRGKITELGTVTKTRVHETLQAAPKSSKNSPQQNAREQIPVTHVVRHGEPKNLEKRELEPGNIETLIPESSKIIARTFSENKEKIEQDFIAMSAGNDPEVMGIVERLIRGGFSLDEIQAMVRTENSEKLSEMLLEQMKQETQEIQQINESPDYKQKLEKVQRALREEAGQIGLQFDSINPKVIYAGKVGALVLNTSIYNNFTPQEGAEGEYLPESHTAVVYVRGNESPEKRLLLHVHEQLHGLSYNSGVERVGLGSLKRFDTDTVPSSGFMRPSKKHGHILLGFNEGVTDYIARSVLKNSGVEFTEPREYDGYVNAVDRVVEFLSNQGEGNKQEMERKILGAYTKKEGNLTIGKMINRHVGPLGFRMLNTMPETFGEILDIMQKYKAGEPQITYDLPATYLEDLKTTPMELKQSFPFLRIYKTELDFETMASKKTYIE